MAGICDHSNGRLTFTEGCEFLGEVKVVLATTEGPHFVKFMSNFRFRVSTFVFNVDKQKVKDI